MRILLTNRRRVGQVDHLAALARYCVKVPEFVARAVLLVNDRLAVGRPDGVILPIVGLDELDGPTSRRAYLPQVRTAGNVSGEYDLLSVRRPGGAKHAACVIKVVDSRGPGSGV